MGRSIHGFTGLTFTWRSWKNSMFFGLCRVLTLNSLATLLLSKHTMASASSEIQKIVCPLGRKRVRKKDAYISTRSTLMPQAVVASSSTVWKKADILCGTSLIGLRYCTSYLHRCRNTFTITEDFMKVFCTKNVSQSGLGQEPGWVMSVFYIGYGDCGIGHPVVDDSIHRHCHRILGQDLKNFTLLRLFSNDSRLRYSSSKKHQVQYGIHAKVSMSTTKTSMTILCFMQWESWTKN